MKRIAFLLIAALTGCTRQDSAPEIGAELVKIESGNEQKWTELVHSVSNPPAPFLANFAYVKREGVSLDDLLSELPKDYPHTFIFVADSQTFASSDRSCLVIDLIDPLNPRFRALPSTLASIENNLSLSNIDFVNFFEAAKPTGIFKGFE